MHKKLHKVAVIGFAHPGLCAVAKSMVKHNAELIVIDKSPAHGPSQTTLETLTAELDKLASESVKAKDATLELTRIAKHTEYFKPKKVHPKHQKNNKYRFNK